MWNRTKKHLPLLGLLLVLWLFYWFLLSAILPLECGFGCTKQDATILGLSTTAAILTAFIWHRIARRFNL
ncbi:hypothetical protein A2755_00140 [Candidatus Wolfebacteria bacterium RIFCSPHIGHO2_01_FULL_48_22]|uniref:Uncharacterized protein n=1 Tax=Candidatus Wolfebacteria bacterium RIFCSPHIGHO2_01_FULL_48_22 TaxID=1802555 RepID=A0A1F8DSX9_9BACT|nr:MAG: hypothetical protein A2755_00140 [Candidatus Wolfebacteria bacterium RIFCSPHIGHO2_01_FULL_48_22]